ncbi:MAG: DUF5615 family PIN-like protein [Ardenticatenales bacterium]|nr:DUF5615 family PIN-like protein [Ardenticatenales bacterium]
MNLRAAAFLADENIHPDVAAHLSATGCDVRHVVSSGLIGAADVDLMRLSVAENRVILTHDSDFGRLAIADHVPYVGIIYLRPGHLLPEFTTASLSALMTSHPDVTPPFLIVARRQRGRVHIRVREQQGQ